MKVLANEIKVYQCSVMQAVFSIHNKRKKASSATLRHSLPPKGKKMDNIEWEPPLNPAVGLIKWDWSRAIIEKYSESASVISGACGLTDRNLFSRFF